MGDRLLGGWGWGWVKCRGGRKRRAGAGGIVCSRGGPPGHAHFQTGFTYDPPICPQSHTPAPPPHPSAPHTLTHTCPFPLHRLPPPHTHICPPTPPSMQVSLNPLRMSYINCTRALRERYVHANSHSSHIVTPPYPHVLIPP